MRDINFSIGHIITMARKKLFQVSNWLLGLPSEEEQELDGIIAQLLPPKVDCKIRRKFMRWVLLGLAGGKCVLCDSKGWLDFHHKDMRKRAKNEYTWRGGMLGGCSDEYFWEEIVPEALNDCILLCRKCHKGIHRRKK